MLHKWGCNIINNDNSRFVVFFSLKRSFLARFSPFLGLDYSTEHCRGTKFQEDSLIFVNLNVFCRLFGLPLSSLRAILHA